MGMISRRRLSLSYTIQQVIPNICTKFQNPRFSVPEKSLTKKKSLHTTPPPPPHTHTNTQTLLLKRQKLYTPYILRVLAIPPDVGAIVRR